MLTIDLNQVIFLDIETVPAFPDFSQVPEEWQSLWTVKSRYLIKDEQTPADIYERAGIYAEFGKIICISAGIFAGPQEFRIKSFYGHDEAKLLGEFSQMLEGLRGPRLLCAHNGKEFDFPYLCRRMIINRMPLPAILNMAGKKPWEVAHLDTMELWKFGDFKSYTSLNLLARSLDIETPKDDIDGSMVASVYYQEGNLERIRTYCQKDVLTLARILIRFLNLPDLEANAVVVVNS